MMTPRPRAADARLRTAGLDAADALVAGLQHVLEFQVLDRTGVRRQLQNRVLRLGVQDQAGGVGAAAHVLDDDPQRGPHRHLDQAGVVDFARQSEDLGPLALVGADGRVPIRPAANDPRDVGEGLDVVDEGRQAEQAALRREGRPRPRHAATAFHRRHQRRFLATDKGPGPDPDRDVEIEGGLEDAGPEQAELLGLLDGGLEALNRQRVFGPHVDETLVGADRIGSDDHSLDDTVRITLQHAPVHEGARVALVGVADDILAGRVGLGDGGPFEAGRIPRPAPPAQPALGDGRDDLLRAHFAQNIPHRPISLGRNVGLDPVRIHQTTVLQHDGNLVGEEGMAQVAAFEVTRLALEFGDDPGGVLGTNPLVEHVLRVRGDQWTFATELDAAHPTDFDLVLQAGFLDRLLEGFLDPLGIGRHATGRQADPQTMFLAAGDFPVFDGNQVFKNHGSSILSLWRRRLRAFGAE